MEYTKEQLGFIGDRGHNVLVSAAAGSGKTAVIVERVIRLITEEGYSVSELLVVTFTRAAAAEMKDRIRDALSERLMSGTLTGAQREHLSKQMSLIFTADINTIDSFCLNLVREHFNKCSIDPSFRVADEGELRLIAQDVMDRLLEDRYESGDEAFYRFVDFASTGRNDSGVAEGIRNVYRFAIARPDPKGYISAMMKQYEVTSEEELEKSIFMQELMRLAKEKIRLVLDILEQAKSICEAPGGPFVYNEMIESDLEQARQLDAANTYSDCRNVAQELSFKALSRKKDDSIDPDLREKAKALRSNAKDILSNLIALDLFSKTTDDIIYELSQCLPYAEMLADLTNEYIDRYEEAKKDRGVVDFSDLEHMALEILRDDETRENIRGRYKELIIDEYQDCNRVQEEIFKAVSNGHDYVTVGDVKQSIYGFRDACPGLFTDKFERYRAGMDEASSLITLSKNFRSSRPVTEAVNGVFGSIMSKECGGAYYDESQSLHYGGVYKHEAPEWNTEYLRIGFDSKGTEKKAVVEARAIAARIRELVGKPLKGHSFPDPVDDPGGDPAEQEGMAEIKPLQLENRKDNKVRECGYGDIVILLRSLKETSDIYAEVFASEGIPLVFDSKSGYLLSYEIREILNLLTIIDNPRQDIPLAGVMMGYFGGFSPSDMVLVRSSAPGENLYDSLVNAAASDDRCRSFVERLDSYRKKSVYTPIHELIEEIISDFHYDHFVRALSDGMRREGNLRLLKKRAAEFEKTSFHGLFKFLRYIDNMKKYDIDFGEASGTVHTDAVRIMSIHHSKGLEFPVVFVSNLSKGINQSDSNDTMIFDDGLGIGLDLIIRERNLKIRTVIKKIISNNMRAATVSEEMRILYVAMTRAENKLILTAVSEEEKENKKVSKTDPAQASTLRDLIETAITRMNDNVSFEIKDIPVIQNENADDAATEPAKASDVREVIELSDKVADGDIEEILKDLRFEYPYEKSVNVPQKVSVSYIKHEAMEEKGVSIASDPRGDRVVPTAGAKRGTAVHTAFEHLRLGMSGTDQEIESYLDSLVAERKLSAEERGYIKTDDISTFLSSDICRRMKEADERHELYREQPFIISVPASRIDKSYPEEDRVMVQGIIDAFFIEDGKVVVVDYKTDSVRDEQILIDRYQAQLDYYESALRQLMTADSSEKVIYSVSLGTEIAL
ncbi:MAG: UvrD-helicase domain-containing protein [Lachnospiraceae bacterium]|nr:UvrD-helicase domain-containing protein [Lachnospiraceae bacterium]